MKHSTDFAIKALELAIHSSTPEKRVEEATLYYSHTLKNASSSTLLNQI